MSFEIASALELPFDDGRFDVVLLQHVAMNIYDRARLYREIRRVLKSGGKFATFDVVLNSGEPHYPLPWARTPATSFLSTAAATREAIEPAGFRTLAWQDDTEAAKAWIAQLRASGPPPSPNLGVVMGPDFAQLSANLGRNLMEGRLGILTAVFEAASTNDLTRSQNVAGNHLPDTSRSRLRRLGCFASAHTSGPGSSRWTGSKRNAPSLRCTASASSGSSSSFQASSAPICPRASPYSPPTATSRPECWPCWRFSQ